MSPRPWNPDRDLPDPGHEEPPIKCASCDEVVTDENMHVDVWPVGMRSRHVIVCQPCYAADHPAEAEDEE